MDKIRAQEMINNEDTQNLAILKNNRKLNEVQNEGGRYNSSLGQREQTHDAVRAVEAAGYAVIRSVVFERGEFEEMRAAWNNAVKILTEAGVQLNIAVISKKSGVDFNLMNSLKAIFVK